MFQSAPGHTGRNNTEEPRPLPCPIIPLVGDASNRGFLSMNTDVSALFDGELDEKAQAAAVLNAPATTQVWETYALIGDALRGDLPLANDLAAHVLARIESEPPPLCAPLSDCGPSVVAFPPNTHTGAVPRFPVWAMAASVAAILLTGWLALQALDPKPHQPHYVPGAAPLAAQPLVEPARQDTAFVQAHREYFLAHQAMAGGGPLGSGVHYVRTIAHIEQAPSQ
jgi:sigma-E factor negative regulatory protein RseA